MPFTPRNAEEHFANQRMTNAAERVATIADALHKQSNQQKKSYEHFHNNLALFASGTVALSVTYLGYLKSLARPVAHPKWLIASWISLLVCLVCSLFWTFFYTHYGHFARNREYEEAQQNKDQIEADEIHHLHIDNLRTPEQLTAFREPRRKAAEIHGRKAKHYERREKLYLFIWRGISLIARITFVFGIAALLCFAINNM